MDRIELIERLAEPLATLPENVRAEALVLSQSDQEVKQSLEFSQILDSSVGNDFFAASASSDAEFLVAVRKRISARHTVTYKPAFLNGKAVAVVASVCTVLVVAVMLGGRFTIEPASVLSPQMAMTQAAEETTSVPIDSAVAADVDPLELAEYLDISDLAEETVESDEDTLPLTDQLLALDTGTLEEVLDELNETYFF